MELVYNLVNKEIREKGHGVHLSRLPFTDKRTALAFQQYHTFLTRMCLNFANGRKREAGSIYCTLD